MVEDPTLEQVIENSTTKVLERRKSWTKPTSAELVSKYLPLWEKLFKEKNNISDDYYREHIKVVFTSTATDRDRQLSKPGERGKEYFFVDAIYNFEWVSFVVSGELTIKEAESDELLSVNQIEKNEYYRLSPLKAVDKLPYNFSEILAALKKIDPQVISLTLKEFTSYSSDDINNRYWLQYQPPGTPEIQEGINLNAFGTINDKVNDCASLTIDILTLKGVSHKSFCWIE